MTLLELQRRMAEDVRRPLTADFRMQQTNEDGHSLDERVSAYIAPNDRLSSFERLEIYNRQYWFRLISAVTEDYPSLQAVLGPKRFDALMFAYLNAHPSPSWTLRDLGAKLPSFLIEHSEFAGARHALAVDVATLEWAYVDAFDSRRVAPLTVEEMQTITSGSRLFLQPHLQLLELSYPVDELVLTVKKDMPEAEAVSAAASHKEAAARVKLPPMRRQRIHLAVHRFDDCVYYRRVEREIFLMLKRLRAGVTLSEAIAFGFEQSGLAQESQLVLIQRGFAHAAELGWFCAGNPLLYE